MRIDIDLSLEDLRVLLCELTPLRIHMSAPDGPERWIELDEPSKVRLEAGRGARVKTSGRIRFTKAKVPVHAEVRCVELSLIPTVVDDGPEGFRLAFRIDIEDGDLVMVPDKIDDGIVSAVNRALTPRATKLIWRFSDTLRTELPLTARMQPVDRVTTEVTGGQATVDDARVRFSIFIKPTLHRGGDRTEHPAA
ncbi:MAG TPA: hypothetical protein RMH99_06750 [Sandaracinaceae bacterium LLY-WYZ-13_1]|nr:hypothetical protein [Sandaracinaceae bacterium LLY-WYZ-13_1]